MLIEVNSVVDTTIFDPITTKLIPGASLPETIVLALEFGHQFVKSHRIYRETTHSNANVEDGCGLLLMGAPASKLIESFIDVHTFISIS